MTDQADLASQLAALQAQLAALRPAATPAAGGWAAPAAAPAQAQIAGVSVPVKLQTPQGSLRCYFHLPADVASSPDALMAAIGALAAAGVPLDVWQPQGQGGGGGGSWGGGGGGWNRGGNNGGWRR